MPGYEDLTADQLMLIMYIVFACFMMLFSSRIIVALIERNTVKYIEVKIKKELSVEPKKASLFTAIGEWWNKRKEKKKVKDEFPLG